MTLKDFFNFICCDKTLLFEIIREQTGKSYFTGNIVDFEQAKIDFGKDYWLKNEIYYIDHHVNENGETIIELHLHGFPINTLRGNFF